MPTSPKNNKDFNFGTTMSELEKIVASLETGELELDEAMQQFEHGAELAEQLQKYLTTTQLKVQSIKTQLDKTDSGLA